MVLEKTLQSSLDCKDIQPVHSKGNQSWVFIGRTDVEAEIAIFWPPDMKSWLIWKDPDVGKDWRQEEKGTTEDKMVGCHHQLNGQESEWTLGVGDGQGGLACCGSWGLKELDTTEWLNWTEYSRNGVPLSSGLNDFCWEILLHLDCFSLIACHFSSTAFQILFSCHWFLEIWPHCVLVCSS